MTLKDFPLVWPMTRYRIDMEVRTPMSLPEYAGSAFRGAFGHALRRIACMTHQPQCPDCPLYRSCPYAKIFETPPPENHILQKFSRVPQPYVIEAPTFGRRIMQPGENLVFHVVLFGQALEQLPLVIFAMKKAFLRGVAGGTASLKKVSIVNEDGVQCIYDEELGIKIIPHDRKVILKEIESKTDVCLRFLTQLRLQRKGRACGPNFLPVETFFKALIRRISLMMEFHAEKVDFDFHALSEASRLVKIETDLSWRNWRRFSTRQNHGMYLGGVLGDFHLMEVPKELQLFLEVGQWLHVGKNTTFGLGKYELFFDLDQTSELSPRGGEKVGKPTQIIPVYNASSGPRSLNGTLI